MRSGKTVGAAAGGCRPGTRRRSGLATVLALVVALAACGDRGETPAPAAPAAAGAPGLEEARAAYEKAAVSQDSRLAAARARLLWLDGRQAAERDRDDARRLFDQALTAGRGDRWLESRVLSSRAELASGTADAAQALPELDRALELARAENDRVRPYSMLHLW